MSLEAITRIRQVEDDMERSKAEARGQAQKLAADAQREGKDLLESRREASAEAAAKAMEEARQRAGQRREEILAQARQDCEALRAEAGKRMDGAVRAILEKVVES